MSKYLQSTVLPETYAMVGRDLAEGRTVLYCGTACQVAGLTGYLESRGVARARLLAVDVICHGAPPPLLWERWRAHVGRSLPSRIKAVDFRRKDPPWEGYSVAYGMPGGRKVLVPHAEDWYLLAFLRSICLRPSCAACPAKGRCGSDVTLGDFWGGRRGPPGSRPVARRVGCDRTHGEGDAGDRGDRRRPRVGPVGVRLRARGQPVARKVPRAASGQRDIHVGALLRRRGRGAAQALATRPPAGADRCGSDWTEASRLTKREK